MLTLNAIFILSGGNLAATYIASIINQLVISAMQRKAGERMRKVRLMNLSGMHLYTRNALHIS